MKRCTVEDCERATHARGWCKTHYKAWRNTGSATGSRRWIKLADTCSIAGCQGKPVARQLCRRHYQRWFRYGDPNIVLRVVRPRAPLLPSGERDVRTYQDVHGALAQHKTGVCATLGCTGEPTEMALLHGHENACVAYGRAKGRLYSFNPDDYVEMCRGCHKRYDGIAGNLGPYYGDRHRFSRGKTGEALAVKARDD